VLILCAGLDFTQVVVRIRGDRLVYPALWHGKSATWFISVVVFQGCVVCSAQPCGSLPEWNIPGLQGIDYPASKSV